MSFSNVRGRIYVVMCLLIIFGVMITNKTNNFTKRSGRDQRQAKEIANSLLIFKLSFIQKNRYLQLGVKTRCLTNERNEINHSFLHFHRGIDFATVKKGSWKINMNYECGRSGSSSLFLAELSVKGPTKAKVQKQRKKSNWKLSHSSILLYPPPLILFQLGFF